MRRVGRSRRRGAIDDQTSRPLRGALYPSIQRACLSGLRGFVDLRDREGRLGQRPSHTRWCSAPFAGRGREPLAASRLRSDSSREPRAPFSRTANDRAVRLASQTILPPSTAAAATPWIASGREDASKKRSCAAMPARARITWKIGRTAAFPLRPRSQPRPAPSKRSRRSKASRSQR